MTVGANEYLDLVEKAHTGALKLPAFQREWKWSTKSVIELFDSLRNRYPIGSFLMAKVSPDLDFSPRPFRFSLGSAEAVAPEKVVLDGQQRLTAGLQLFFAKPGTQTTCYYICIGKVEDALREYARKRSITVDKVMEDDDELAAFSSDIDVDSGYIKGIARIADPYGRLRTHDQIFTPLLTKVNERKLDVLLDDYLDAKPDKRALIRKVVVPLFRLSSTTAVPHITIENTDVQAVSRIFSTLNSTGKTLTPFELVVAIRFSDVDLRAEISEFRARFPLYYPNMDQTGEIALQTCVLLDGEDPKKSLLPRTLTTQRWQRHKEAAFSALEAVGKFLTEHLGFALDKTAKYIPYDSVFAPMAVALSSIDLSSMSPTERAAVHKKLARYVVGVSMTQWYQEGVHNKQKGDAAALIRWLSTPGDAGMPAFLREVTVPPLMRVDPSGAIGKTLLCLLNRQSLRDPVDGTPVPLGDPAGDDHHLFPTRFCKSLPGWQDSEHSANRALNIVRVSKSTNASWLNSDPAMQLSQFASSGSDSPSLDSFMQQQLLSDEAVEIMRRPNKTATDFQAFLTARQKEFRGLLFREFGFSAATPTLEDQEELIE